MSGGTEANRAEICRLVSWFDTQFYGDLVAPLLHERMIKRHVHRATPDARALREAMKAALQHLDYTDYLLVHRPWLGGATMTLAHLAPAAHISVAASLGGSDWNGPEAHAGWY